MFSDFAHTMLQQVTTGIYVENRGKLIKEERRENFTNWLQRVLAMVLLVCLLE